MFPLRPSAGNKPADGFGDALALDELPVGGQQAVQIGTRRILLCRSGETEIHAVSDICPHALQPLCGGDIVDGAIRCPKHGARFDLGTGQPRNGVTRQPLPVHEVRIVAGRIQVAYQPRP